MPIPQPTTPSKAAETAAVTVLLTNEQLAQVDEVSAIACGPRPYIPSVADSDLVD